MLVVLLFPAQLPVVENRELLKLNSSDFFVNKFNVILNSLSSCYALSIDGDGFLSTLHSARWDLMS